MQKITPCLWFDAEGEEAAEFYVSLFGDAKILEVTHYGEAGPRPVGTVMTVSFMLEGQEDMALNGRPGVPVHRGRLLLGQLRGPGGGRPAVGAPARGRRSRGCLRMDQGPVRPV